MANELEIQPSAKDNYLTSLAPTTNYGTETTFQVYDRDINTMRSILEFDLSGLPAGAIIISASLQLYYFTRSGTDPVGKTVWAYKLIRTDWVEIESTWNIYKTDNNWTAAGGDYVTSEPDGGSAVIPANTGTWMSWDVLAIVQDAYGASNPAEFLIRFETEGLAEGYGSARWRSRDYTTDPNVCPKLVITYKVTETYTKTVDIDALLKETDTETVDIDTLLQALGITKTVAIDALLEATDAKTVNLDVLVKELGIAKTVALDVILGLFASQVDLDVLLRATDTKTVDLDTLIKAVGVVGLGRALSFDGDDYVDCGSGSSLELTGDFTFELWIRPDAWDANVNQPFLAKGVSGGVLNWYIGETTANVLKFVYYSDGYKEVVDTSGASWMNGTWYHVVVVIKEASNVVNFYRNGALLSSVSGVFDNFPIITTDEIAQIGRYVSTEYWKGGLIDEVRIYSRALELAEVTANYNSGKGTYKPYDVSNLVAWWHIDEGSGNEIVDSSGEGNTGTIYGATWVGGIIPITTPSLDVLLKAVDTKTADLDVLIQALGITKTAALDALIRKLGATETVNLDTLLALVKLTQTVTIDTFLGKTDSKTIDLDVYLRALDVLQTVNLDTLIQAIDVTKTVAIDALLKVVDTKTVNLDALLKGLDITKTVALDAILMGIGTKTVDLDTLIKGIASKTVQLDVIIWAYPTGALDYIIEIRDSSGNLLAVLEHAHGINLTEQLNRPPMLDFNLPADDSKATYIVFGNQVWLRNYATGELIKKFLISKRSDTRQ